MTKVAGMNLGAENAEISECSMNEDERRLLEESGSISGANDMEMFCGKSAEHGGISTAEVPLVDVVKKGLGSLITYMKDTVEAIMRL